MAAAAANRDAGSGGGEKPAGAPPFCQGGGAFGGRRTAGLPGPAGQGGSRSPHQRRRRAGEMVARQQHQQPQPQRRFPVPPFFSFSFFLLLLLLPGGSSGGKYSREANEGGPEEKAPPPVEFRLLRLNQVWEKAQRLPLSATRLAELHGDLRLQEKDELRWKKLKAEGGGLGHEEEEEEEEEARLRRNLHVILAKYGMNGKKDAPPGATNYIKDGLEDDFLGDPRLEKLWNKAKASGRFSEEELEKLWREFKHHKEKVHEYNILLETVSRTEDSHKNMISPTEEEEGGPWKVERLHNKHSELKEKLHSINQGFERLRRVSHQGFDPTSEFEEPRVIDLWEMAKSTNFTEEELASLREELKHFEAKVEKHHHYQKQLEISHQKLKHVEGMGDSQHLSQHKEKYAMLEEKTKELGYKVKKHLQDLSGRISRGLQHNEL